MTRFRVNALSRVAILLLGSLLPYPALTSDLQQHQVTSLGYGEALYHYFQQQELGAMNRILVDQHRGTLGQAGYSRLLLADLYYRYGLHEESQDLFAELLEQTEAIPLLNQIWFNLARLSYERALFDDAENFLLRIEGSLPYSYEQERQAMLSNLALERNEFIPALEFTDEIDPSSDWSRFSFYNIAVALLENKRASQGEQLLEYVIELEVDNEAHAALRDQALLSLAIKQIGSKRYESAEAYLQRIRLNGPASDRAILATGWLYQHQGKLDKAVNSWRYLIQRARPNAETREAILAIPMSQEKAGQLREALQSYHAASRRFDQHQQIVQRASLAITNNQLLETINTQLNGSTRATEPVARTSAELAEMLYLLLASAPFQSELDRLRELFAMRDQLQQWQANLPTLVLMLEERRARFALKRPLLDQNLDGGQAIDLVTTLDKLKASVERIETQQDHNALLSSAEQDQLERLQRIEETINTIAEKRDTSYQRDMSRLYRGLLEWQSSNAYPQRIWQVKKNLGRLEELINQNQQSLLSLSQLSQLSANRFTVFDERIVGKQNSITVLLAQCEQLITRQLDKLNRAAQAELAQQQKFLLELKVNTGYAIARLSEQLADDS